MRAVDHGLSWNGVLSGLPDKILVRTRLSPSGCWEFTGAKHSGGYGQVRWQGRTAYVHRLAYELLVGPIPNRMQIDHLCRNRACCFPNHLEVVTAAENTRRGEPAQRTHCPAGHPYDERNTYLRSDGRRMCRRCHALRVTRTKALARRRQT